MTALRDSRGRFRQRRTLADPFGRAPVPRGEEQQALDAAAGAARESERVLVAQLDAMTNPEPEPKDFNERLRRSARRRPMPAALLPRPTTDPKGDDAA